MARTPKEPSSTTGTVIAGIRVARQSCRKMKMTATTSRMATIRVWITSWIDSLTKVVVSTGKAAFMPSGKVDSSCPTLALTAATVLSALAPGASRTAMPEAG